MLSSSITSNVCSAQTLDEMIKNPYMLELAHSKEDFATRIFPYATTLQNVTNRGVKLKLKKLYNGVAGMSYGESRKIAVDIEQNAYKSDIVNTINHELRHQYQTSESSSLGIFEKLKYFMIDINPFKKRCLVEEYKSLTFAQNCAKNLAHYIPINKNMSGYYNQFLEVDARKAGKAAQVEIDKLITNLEKTFPILKDIASIKNKLLFDNILKKAKVVDLNSILTKNS